MNHALNAFAFPSEAGTHLPTPDWRLSWSWVGGWLHIEINVLHREMNPDTAPISGAQRRLTSLIEANGLTTIRRTTRLIKDNGKR